LHEAVVDRRVVPFLGDLFMALAILQGTVVGKVNTIE
jgi:hypothetical protein